MSKQSVYTFTNVSIAETDDHLKISLTRKERRRCLFFLIFMPLFAIGVFLWLRRMPMRKIDSLETLVFAILVLGIVAVMYVNAVIKIAKSLRDILFEKRSNVILMNGKILCERNMLKSIIVQPKIGIYGYGLSCTIGIGFNNKARPISFFHS